MRPETSLWRKDGRRIARRDSEPVLDERREREVRVASKVPGLFYRLDDFRADGTPDGYKTITVTPELGRESLMDAATGQDLAEAATPAEQAAVVADLTHDMEDRLPAVLRSHARSVLAMADALEHGRRLMPAGPDYAYEPAAMDCGA